MWSNISPITNTQMNLFESHFSFRIDPPLRDFLLEHNGGSPTSCIFPTNIRNREIAYLLDIRESRSDKSAWTVNQRVRRLIGPKRLVIGVDSLGNFICVEREYKQQEIVLWNHVTNAFEKCQWSIPILLQSIG